MNHTDHDIARFNSPHGDDMDVLLESVDIGVLLATFTFTEVDLHAMNRELKTPADPDLPPPEIPTSTQSSKPEENVDVFTESKNIKVEKSRFRTVTNEQLKNYEESNQSKSTKKNTAW